MARKHLLEQLLNPTDPATSPETSAAVEPPRKPPGLNVSAVKAVGRSLDALVADQVAYKELSEKLQTGAQVVDVDTGLIEPAIVSDRIGGFDEADVMDLAHSIRSQGQLVPVLLRPHPERRGHFQTAYGHRRVAAARLLDRPIRAVIRPLSDDEMVIAQGKENGERKNLTFIERALFAHELDKRGFTRVVIGAALSIDKTELSRLLAVVEGVGSDVVTKIGPAPKVGRPRWMQFAESCRDAKNLSGLTELLGSKRFLDATSDQRFDLAAGALAAKPAKSAKPRTWVAEDGRKVAAISRDDRSLKLSINEAIAPDFGEFLVSKLPDLYQEYRRKR